jgi:hypothetical protein
LAVSKLAYISERKVLLAGGLPDKPSEQGGKESATSF